MNPESIVEGIIEGKKVASREGIRANMVLINEKYAKIMSHCLLLEDGCRTIMYPKPCMIAGLEGWFTDEIPEEIAFCLLEGNTEARRIDSIRRENEELRAKLSAIREVLGMEDDE